MKNEMSEEEVVAELQELISMGLVESFLHNGEELFRLTDYGETVADEMGLIPEDLKGNLH